MLDLKFPEQMIVRTLWALWSLFFGGAILWLLVGSVAYWVKHGWLPPDASGWVQGLGSILAIAIAIAIPWNQKRHEALIKAEEIKSVELARSEQLLCLCKEVIRTIELLNPGNLDGYVDLSSYQKKRLH
ncbi:hypothetical protein [Pseudomonas fluorescens]|uniref:Uncharacterized protein n=1 Tax=Pseudomonas fluorescens TaxID=294 RepID=A0A0F4UUR9_PSEFL|nr:hypothetical protein [Pseudomonas fluorescens]KJZ59512.1 hypothetical protein VD17_30210 [Pseudomonas fluorescens]